MRKCRSVAPALEQSIGAAIGAEKLTSGQLRRRPASALQAFSCCAHMCWRPVCLMFSASADAADMANANAAIMKDAAFFEMALLDLL
jgi:hypothetical protein